MSVQKIPEGFATITPSLVVNGAAQAIELYTKAFGAKELHCMKAPNSDKIMHACIQVGTSKVFLADASPDGGCMAPSVSSFYLYMEDVDATFQKARQAGMQEVMPVQDMFWGDRTGCVTDSFGNKWTIATHVRDVSPQDMEEASKKFFNKAA